MKKLRHQAIVQQTVDDIKKIVERYPKNAARIAWETPRVEIYYLYEWALHDRSRSDEDPLYFKNPNDGTLPYSGAKKLPTKTAKDRKDFESFMEAVAAILRKEYENF